MRVRDARDRLQLARPGDLLEEAVRVRDMRLDLTALLLVEVAAANHEELQLVVLEQRADVAIEVDEGPPPDRFERLEASFGEHGRLVRLHDRVEEAGELLASLPPFALEPMETSLVSAAAVLQQ